MKNVYMYFALTVLAVVLILVEKFIHMKIEATKQEIKDISAMENKISTLYIKVNDLNYFIKIQGLKPVSKEEAHKKLLNILEILKKEFNVVISENRVSKNMLYAKITFEDNYQGKERIIDFFEKAFHTEDQVIVSVDLFDLQTSLSGSLTKTVLSIYIPFVEVRK